MTELHMLVEDFEPQHVAHALRGFNDKLYTDLMKTRKLNPDAILVVSARVQTQEEFKLERQPVTEQAESEQTESADTTEDLEPTETITESSEDEEEGRLESSEETSDGERPEFE